MTKQDGASVGVFWGVAIEGQTILLLHRCSLKSGEKYGEFITCPHGHYDIWEAWRNGIEPKPENSGRLVAAYEYEEWPRGRVVFHRERDQFLIYADAKLHREHIKPLILKAFDIEQAAWLRDGHYLSTQHLPPASDGSELE